MPSTNWVGSITNIDDNNLGPFPTNSDSPLYVYGDRWYYQANDSIGGGTGKGGTYHDYGWVELGWNITSSSTAVPEPATMLLLGSGLLGLAGFARKKFKK